MFTRLNLQQLLSELFVAKNAMDNLPDTVLTSILSYSSRSTLSTLSQTSKAISTNINNLSQGDYLWKNMVLSHFDMPLNAKITYQPTKGWKDVYMFVCAIKRKTYLLFTRDPFYAELGLLIGISLAQDVLKKCIKCAQAETIKFLLDSTSSNTIWDDEFSLLTAMRMYREDIGMILLEDGRCLKECDTLRIDVNEIAQYSLLYGCGKIFMYLVNRFFDRIKFNSFISFYVIRACCYGLDIAVKTIHRHGTFSTYLKERLLQFVLSDNPEECTSVDTLRRTIIEDPCCIPAMIASGRTKHAAVLLGKKNNISSMICDSICIGLSRGNIKDVSQIKPFLSLTSSEPFDILNNMMEDPNHSTEIISELAKLVSLYQRNILAKKAKDNGNFEYVDALKTN